MDQGAPNRDEWLSARAISALLCVAILAVETAWLSLLALAVIETGKWMFG